MKNQRFESFSIVISQIIKSLQSIKSHKMAEYGLKGTTCTCLCHIFRSEDGLNAGELAQLCEIDKAQVSRCVSELCEKGFIYRDDREGRRYKQKYRLTENGMKAARDVVLTLQGLQAKVTAGISAEELDVFQGVLRKLCNNYSALAAENESQT